MTDSIPGGSLVGAGGSWWDKNDRNPPGSDRDPPAHQVFGKLISCKDQVKVSFGVHSMKG